MAAKLPPGDSKPSGTALSPVLPETIAAAPRLTESTTTGSFTESSFEGGTFYGQHSCKSQWRIYGDDVGKSPGGIAITIGGSGTKFVSNVVSRNGNAGVQVTGTDTTISKNAIFSNKGLAIDLAPMGANMSDDSGHNSPTIDAASQWTKAGLDLRGTLLSRPNQTYTIELFASSAAATGITMAPPVRNGPPGTDQPGALLPAGGVAAPGTTTAPPPAADAARGAGRGPRGGGPGPATDAVKATATATATPTGDGERYLGTVTVTTDAKGFGTFTLLVAGADPLGAGKTTAFVAGTATDAAGSTSEFGQARPLIKK